MILIVTPIFINLLANFSIHHYHHCYSLGTMRVSTKKIYLHSGVFMFQTLLKTPTNLLPKQRIIEKKKIHSFLIGSNASVLVTIPNFASNKLNNKSTKYITVFIRSTIYLWMGKSKSLIIQTFKLARDLQAEMSHDILDWFWSG